MKSAMRRVLLEAPYTGWSWHHLAYTQACMVDSMGRHEAPMVGHLLYPPQFGPEGMDAADAWESACEWLVLYLDMGMTHNMRQAVVRAVHAKMPVEPRVLDEKNSDVAHRFRLALLGRREAELAPDDCRHQSDTPVFDARAPGRILSWRCACGTVGPTESQVKAAILEDVGT